jgi:heptaprenyl diphosphate synthase
MTASRHSGGYGLPARRLTRLGLLSAAAVAAYVFESMLPVPVPWARVGLSNIFVLVALFGVGTGEAFLVNLVRVVAGNLLMGIILSPAFLLGFVGSNVALIVMALVRRTLVPPLSILGTSCLGAATNNAVQVLLFMVILSWSGLVTELLGIFVLMGVGVGFVTGLIASRVLAKVRLETTGPVG